MISTQELLHLLESTSPTDLSAHEDILNKILIDKNLTIQEISNFGKKYLLKDFSNVNAVARATLFATLLAQQKKIQTIEDMLILLNIFSNDAKKVIFRAFKDNDEEFAKLPILKLIKEAGLIAGLQGPFYEGGLLSETNEMAKRRFRNLSPDASSSKFVPLAFHLIEDYKNGADFYNHVREHGDLRGIHAEWEKHAFSFHLIKDGNQTHLIYVNRGQKHELAKNDDPAVRVFTFDDPKMMRPVLSKLIETLKTKERKKISDFIVNFLIPHQNDILTEELKKSNQKVGNCSVANANIAWHFALASREMKKTHCSFFEAYKNTKEAYKNMRMEDRAQVFCELMTNPDLKVFQKNAVSQIMKKMIKKDSEGRETIRFLLDRLHTKDPNAVKALFNDLYCSTYKINDSDRLKWATACVNKLKAEGIDLAGENIDQKIQSMEGYSTENREESSLTTHNIASNLFDAKQGGSKELQEQGAKIEEGRMSFNCVQSKMSLINEYLKAQIERLEQKKRDTLLMKGADDKIKGFANCQKKIGKCLKKYSQNTPTQEVFMQFQKELLNEIDRVSSQRGFKFAFLESKSQSDFSTLIKGLEEIKELEEVENQTNLKPKIHK